MTIQKLQLMKNKGLQVWNDSFIQHKEVDNHFCHL